MINKPQPLTIEQCQALYFDKKVLMYPDRKLFRVHGYVAGRYYFEDLGKEIKWYISVTNLIASTMPTAEPLKKWIADMGYEESQRYASERADYGTFMHIKFHELLINRELNLDAIDEDLRIYMEDMKISPNLFDSWLEDIKRDVLGFAQFLKDYKVKPLAIEVVLASQDGYAGAVDLICLMTITEKGFFGEVYKSGDNKGNPKETKRETEVFAILDFKSGRKNFYESHEIQLEAYKCTVRENFPALDTDKMKLFNYSPNEWRTAPGYKIKDQTDSPNRRKLQHLVNIAAIEMGKRERSVLKIEGTLNLDNPVEECFREVTIDELIIEQRKTIE